MRRMTAAARLEVELDHGVGEHEQDGPCKGQPKSLRPPETFKRSQPHQKRVFTRWEGLVGLKVVPPEQPASKSTSTIAQSLTDFPQDHRRTLAGFDFRKARHAATWWDFQTMRRQRHARCPGRRTSGNPGQVVCVLPRGGPTSARAPL